MLQVHDGQCGLCVHFGEAHKSAPQLTKIREKHEAPDNLVEECGYPRYAPLHLKVTPTAQCDAFEAAKAA